MGKGRAPCCDKSQVKRGPWSPSEDLRLIAFIQKHGHENWRALPKQAGLLRCGKSCRLRWINYLRPDVKRGNFTKEEEDSIIKLHEALGNKWSKIASCLPGRTDNEIKNMWNTHLKKRLVDQKSGLTIHRPDGSPKESSSATSSCSSSSITSVSCGGSSFKADEIEHYVSAMKSQCNEPVKMVDDGSKASNFVSCDNCNSKALHLESHVNHQQIDGSLELGGWNSSETNIGAGAMQEVNKPAGLLEIPLESDADFWNMLDGLDPFVTSNGQVNHNLQGVGDHEDGYNKWFEHLENELGLEGQNYSDYPLVREVVDPMMGYFRPLPSSARGS